MKRLVLALITLTVATGCTGGDSHARATGTVSGVFSRGMGVVKAPHSERDKVTLIDAHGRRLVAGVSTTGRFSVTATPGKYTLTGPPGASPYDCPRIRITVTARTITRAQIRCGRWTD